MDMIKIKVLQDKTDELAKQRNIAEGKKIAYTQQLSAVEGNIYSITQKNEIREKVSAVLGMAGGKTRDNARKHFENIITEALQYITQSNDYKFIVEEMTTRSKPSYEFYVESTVNGVRTKQKPQDAVGGGFVDIISTAIKYAYLEIFNDPKIMNKAIFFDEPGKMVSSMMSVKFAEYVKFLGKHFNRQTIMITHNEDLSVTADKSFLVSKGINGCSTVKELGTLDSLINYEKLDKEIEERV